MVSAAIAVAATTAKAAVTVADGADPVAAAPAEAFEGRPSLSLPKSTTKKISQLWDNHLKVSIVGKNPVHTAGYVILYCYCICRVTKSLHPLNSTTSVRKRKSLIRQLLRHHLPPYYPSFVLLTDFLVSGPCSPLKRLVLPILFHILSALSVYTHTHTLV